MKKKNLRECCCCATCGITDACGGCCEWIWDVTTDDIGAVVAKTNVTGVDDGATGDGCGTAAGAGLIDEVVGCALGDTAAPEFNALRPRALWKLEKKIEKFRFG